MACQGYLAIRWKWHIWKHRPSQPGSQLPTGGGGSPLALVPLGALGPCGTSQEVDLDVGTLDLVDLGTLDLVIHPSDLTHLTSRFLAVFLAYRRKFGPPKGRFPLKPRSNRTSETCPSYVHPRVGWADGTHLDLLARLMGPQWDIHPAHGHPMGTMQITTWKEHMYTKIWTYRIYAISGISPRISFKWDIQNLAINHERTDSWDIRTRPSGPDLG